MNEERSAWRFLQDIWSKAHLGGKVGDSAYTVVINDEPCIGLCSSINALTVSKETKAVMIAKLPSAGVKFDWATDTIAGAMGRHYFCAALAETI